MTQIPAVQVPPYQITSQPSYNAVKIDIHNPQVNAPTYTQNPIKTPGKEDPVYTYPKASVYEVPKQSIYEPKPQPQSVPEVPSVPPPVIVQPSAVKAPEVITTVPTTAPIAAITPTAPVAPISPAAPTTPVVPSAPEAPKKPEAVETPVVPAEPQKVEVAEPQKKNEPKLDINEFITKLTSSDVEQQANALEAIAVLAETKPKLATELLDTKVVDTLLSIMKADTSKLEGPTAQQISIREKIVAGQTVSDEEMTIANKTTPMELAERNKQYSMYTVAILDKLYGSEIEKINNTVVPLTELPGAAGIVEQLKNNPNPMVRLSAIDALSYVQRPEYKQDLTTLFIIAQKDQDPGVQKAATLALDKLAKLAETAPKVEQTKAQA